MAKDDLAKTLDCRLKKAQELRQTWDTTLQEIAEYIIPTKADFTVTWERGQQRNRRMFDSTAGEALNLLAASLQSLLTHPSIKWLTMRPNESDINLEDNAEVADWVDDSVNVIMSTLFSDGVNFTPAAHEFYLEIGAFGTAALYVDSDNDTIIKVRAYPIKDIYFCEDVYGVPDTVYLRQSLSARQIAQQFDSYSDKVKNALDRNPEKTFEVIHACYPREDWPKDIPMKSRTQRDMPIASVWYERGTLEVLEEGGYHEMPYCVARWSKSAGEVMGRGPGLSALPFIRSLNEMVYTAMLYSEKAADQPLLVPDDDVLGTINTGAGGLIYYRAGTGGDGIKPLPLSGDLSGALMLIERNTEAIRRIFLNNQLQMVGGPQMTATEVLQLQEEKMMALGPVVGRLQSEFLSRFVNRVFGILLRSGAIPQPPEVLQGRNIGFEYVSPISRAQKLRDATAFQQAAEFVSPVAQFSPDALMNFDPDEIVRASREIFGYPSDFLRPKEDVAAMRKQAQEAQAAQAQANAVQQGVEVAGEAAKAGLING